MTRRTTCVYENNRLITRESIQFHVRIWPLNGSRNVHAYTVENETTS